MSDCCARPGTFNIAPALPEQLSGLLAPTTACPQQHAHATVPPACSESNRGEAELAQLFDGYERALRFDRQVC